MAIEQMIVLARSRKYGGRCLAGISAETGRWVRPVSRLDHGELHEAHCAIDGAYPRHLDIVRFAHTGPEGDIAQPENLLLADTPWERVGRLSASDAYRELHQFLEPGPVLLGNRGKAVHEDQAVAGLEASLALIEPENLEFALVPKDSAAGASPRARFTLGGRDYDLPLTEYTVRPRLFKAGFGVYDLAALRLEAQNHVLMTASLGEPLGLWRHKLVAAVLALP